MNAILAAFLAGLFTWGVTALGASLVFFFKNLNKKITNVMLGFAAGIMVAASFWSLLAPAIEASEHLGALKAGPPLIGFLLGGAFLLLIDHLIPHLHMGSKTPEGLQSASTNISRSILLVVAITIHNIPEGLAVGVAFGAAARGDAGAFASAIVLAIGIGLQNFPEGAAVSIPLRGEGFSRAKSFWYGQLSAIVEPIFAVLGAVLVDQAEPILPYALSFAAGAMIFVVIEELIPESQRGDGADLSAIGAMLGFAIMMVLDVTLG
ncbi:MAG: ZIP family metal transporter [Clostridiaceae bacterium]|jgi:ZIP family zinc transporter|nr:ZIP family metal transporter [Clostridiaceae bacterium]